jgi:hypothetical protein
MDNFLAIVRPRDYDGYWASAKPTRQELAVREQEYYDRFSAPWGDAPRGLPAKALLARVIAVFGVLGMVALLAR